MSECVEVVRLRPKDGAAERLMEIRPRMAKGLMDSNSAIRRLMLLRIDDETWLDIVWWSSREAAEQALAARQGQHVPAFQEWSSEIDELVSVDVTDIVADSAPSDTSGLA